MVHLLMPYTPSPPLSIQYSDTTEVGYCYCRHQIPSIGYCHWRHSGRRAEDKTDGAIVMETEAAVAKASNRIEGESTSISSPSFCFCSFSSLAWLL